MVAADILSSSARLADTFIEEKKSEDDSMPSLEEAPAEVKHEDITIEMSENEVIENALKKGSAEDGSKETLVDDLNAEIGEGDEDTNGASSDLTPGELANAQEGSRARSRNAEKVEDKNLSLDNEEETKSVDLEEKKAPLTPPAPPTYDYTLMDELFEFFNQDEI
jgi:hypothetical protein